MAGPSSSRAMATPTWTSSSASCARVSVSIASLNSSVITSESGRSPWNSVFARAAIRPYMRRMKPVAFIHTNAKQMLGALVSAHSYRRNSRNPDAFEVRILLAEDYPELQEKGRTFLRGGHERAWDPD